MDSKSSNFSPFLYGGLAAMTAEAITFPLDTTKTRLQLQAKQTGYNGAFRTARSIVQEEGFSTLYTGIKPALLRQAVYGTIKFGIYYTSKDIMYKRFNVQQQSAESTSGGDNSNDQKCQCLIKNDIPPASESLDGLEAPLAPPPSEGQVNAHAPCQNKDCKDKNVRDQNESNAINVGCAVFAGCVSSAIANPTDLLKVRHQAKGGYPEKGLITAFVNIWDKEGVRGLWRGVGPTSQRAALVAGVQLPVYDFTKSFFLRRNLINEGGVLQFCCSIVAGFSACAASNPCDVVRTRMMVQRKLLSDVNKAELQNQIYKSPIDCVVQSVRQEGPACLFKGFVPSFARMGPWNAIFFLVYENLVKMEESRRKDKEKRGSRSR